MKSQNITNCSNNHLTAEEICAIIKICGESGVQNITFKDLHVSFSGPKANDKDPIAHSPGPVWNSLDDKKSLAQLEVDLMDDRLAEMQISDPVRYEELMANKDLSN
jgi:hypothetical protein